MLQTSTQQLHHLKHKLQEQSVHQLGCFAGLKNTNYAAVLQTSKQELYQVLSKNTNCDAVLQTSGQRLCRFQSSITSKLLNEGNSDNQIVHRIFCVVGWVQNSDVGRGVLQLVMSTQFQVVKYTFIKGRIRVSRLPEVEEM